MSKFDNVYATNANAKVCTILDTVPVEYYGGKVGQDTDNLTWIGGELAYLTTQARLYIQTATSGTTATWKLLADTFATSTSTSTSSSTTSTSSTSTSSSTTSSSTTSTSTTSSSTTTSSSSTSTSSTTTMA